MASISIILTVYNAEKYINKCMDSLVSQSFSDIEIIAVNDGSTDGTKNILESYSIKDSRVKVINQENMGLEISRSNALKEVGGKYIMFCDSDDWYEKEMCEKMFLAIENNNVDLVFCKTSVIREIETQRLYKSKYYDFDKSGIYKINLELIKEINSVLWNKIFKAEIIKNNCMDFPRVKNIRVGWDAFFVMEYMLHSDNILYLDDYLYNYRLHGGSLMDDIYKGDSKSINDIWNNLEEFYDILISKKLMDDDVMDFFLDKYRSKTIYYFQFLKDNDKKRLAIAKAGAFLDKIKNDSELIGRFREKYIKELEVIKDDRV